MGLQLVKTKFAILATLTPLMILLDQWTKLLVIEHFALGESRVVLGGFFNLTYVRNTGAAFGIMAQANPAFRIPFFIIVPLIALGAIGFIFRKISNQDRKMAVALALVISGAVGNLIDRVRLGYVVDFLDFHYKWTYHFPAFNVADACISVGIGLLMVDLLFQKETEPHVSRTV